MKELSAIVMSVQKLERHVRVEATGKSVNVIYVTEVDKQPRVGDSVKISIPWAVEVAE